MEVFRVAAAPMVRSMAFTAQAADQRRLLFLQRAATAGGAIPELAWLRDETRRLECGNRVLMAPLGDPNAGWVVQTLEEAFAHHGAPRHLITDQGGVFVSGVLSDLLIRGHVKHRLGAVGQPGSVAVTERAILMLKYECLRRVPATRGLDHLSRLLRHFGIYYNEYRGHATLGGAAPAANDRGERRNKPAKSVRTASTGAE